MVDVKLTVIVPATISHFKTGSANKARTNKARKERRRPACSAFSNKERRRPACMVSINGPFPEVRQARRLRSLLALLVGLRPLDRVFA